MKDLVTYWLAVNRHHRDLKWLSCDDWESDQQEHITDALKSTKAVLCTLADIIEENQ